VIKVKGLQHIIIHNVVNGLEAKTIKRLGPKIPINFSDISANKGAKVVRTMQLVDKPDNYLRRA
jgi:hypothetical protein